jgi:hypothetical protein
MDFFSFRSVSRGGFSSSSKLRNDVIRTTCLALSLSVVSTGFGLVPAQAASTYDGMNGVVDCSTSGTFTIADNVVTTSSSCEGDVVIPEGVTTISGGINLNHPEVGKVVIPASLTTVDLYTFGAAKVTSFEVSSSSQYFKVGNGLLLTKDGTEVVAHPNGSAGTAVVVPPGVLQIRQSAFYYTSITSISLPQSLATISIDAFRGAPLVAFTVTAGNTTFNAIDGVLFSGTTLVNYPPAKVNENGLYSIPETTTALANYSFQDTNSIVTLALPASLTSIENGALNGLSSIPASLQSVTVTAGNTTFNAIDGVLFSGTTLVKYPVKKSGTSYVVPAQTSEIGYAAFSYARALTSVTLPSSLRVIGYDGFARTSFTSIVLPSGLTTIDQYAFVENYLTSVTIPSSVTSINNGAFLSNSITTVNFSGNAPTIGSGIFGGNSVSIIENVVGSLCWGATFDGIAVRHTSPPRTCSTYDGTQGVVDCGTSGTFTIADNVVVNDNGCAGSIAIPEGVSSVGADVLVDNQLLTSVTIPSSVTSLGAYSFTGAFSLLGFTVHSSNNDFSSSNGILFNKSGTTLVRYPATKGTTYTIPETVTSVGNYAFHKTRVTNVTLSSGVTNIGMFAFRDNSLTSVTIPSSVTNIGAWAFGLNLLTTVTIPSSVASVGNYAFYGNDLTSVTIQNGVADIGVGVFIENELTSVTIPSSVTSIGAYAFAFNSLASVNFLGNAPPEQESIFDSNPGLTVIDAVIGSTGWGSTFSGLPVRVPTVGTPAVETPPAPDVAPAPAPVVSPTPSAAKTPSLAVVGTPVAITRTPSAAIASAVAIGVNKTKVMLALKVPTAAKAANQVTKYVITLKTSKGVTITRTISVKPGRSVSPTLTGKKETSYSMTVTAVTKSGKKTTWKGPRVKTS